MNLIKKLLMIGAISLISPLAMALSVVHFPVTVKVFNDNASGQDSFMLNYSVDASGVIPQAFVKQNGLTATPSPVAPGGVMALTDGANSFVVTVVAPAISGTLNFSFNVAFTNSQNGQVSNVTLPIGIIPGDGAFSTVDPAGTYPSNNKQAFCTVATSNTSSEKTGDEGEITQGEIDIHCLSAFNAAGKGLLTHHLN